MFCGEKKLGNQFLSGSHNNLNKIKAGAEQFIEGAIQSAREKYPEAEEYLKEAQNW